MTALGRSLLAATLVISSPAAAQVSVETRVSARQVEVNQPFQLELKAMSDGQTNPSDPRLTVPNGIRAQGPSFGTQTEVSLSQGRMIQRVGISATWTLTAIRPGKYRIGPPSISIDGQRQQGRVVEVEVVPEGSGPARRPGGIPGRMPFDPFDFFDPFRQFPRLPFDNNDLDPPQVPEYPPELAIDRLRDPIAFVVAKVKPQRVVLGQAVHFALYAYGLRGTFQVGAATEPSREGFIAYTVEDDRIRPYTIPFGNELVLGAKVSELVLFPIRTGTLRIGSARLGFQGRSYSRSNNPAGLMRQSDPVDIVVVEPPLAGRPIGYHLGDVGQYTLTASVAPKSVQQGEAISVVARLEGTGNVPPKLNLPQQNGIEWMEPTVVEKIDAENGTVKGQRTFTYVVRLDRAGSIDLGEITLPFYDADKHRYDIARAVLGTVEVKANPNAVHRPENTAGPSDRLQGLLAPRKTLRAVAKPRPPLSDRGIFWALLVGAPLGVLSLGGALRAGTRWYEKVRSERATPLRKAKEELERARESASAGNVAATAAAVERAVHFALESRTGLRARGVLRTELPRSLAARGMPDELADSVVSLLEATELSRFVQGGVEERAEELRARGEEVVRAVLRGKL